MICKEPYELVHGPLKGENLKHVQKLENLLIPSYSSLKVDCC